jgi:hypothetical protein
MLLHLLIAVPLVLAQDPPLSPFDEVHELELGAEDEALVEGHGPAQIVEYEIEFDGTLHVWTHSELDLFLRVEDGEGASSWRSDIVPASPALRQHASGSSGVLPLHQLREAVTVEWQRGCPFA